MNDEYIKRDARVYKTLLQKMSPSQALDIIREYRKKQGLHCTILPTQFRNLIYFKIV